MYSVTEVLVALLIVILVWILLVSPLQQWYSKHSRFCHLMSELPGPKIVPLFGNTYEFVENPLNKFTELLTHMIKTHGPIFRMWVGPFTCTVHVSSWRYAESIFNSSVHIDKSSLYSFLHSWLGTGLLTSTGAKWHLRRKLLTPAFHRSVLDSFQEVFSDKSDTLIKILEVERKKSESFDIAPFIWQCSLDIICETAMGTKMNIQESVSKNDTAYLKAISYAAESGLYRLLRPWLHPQLLFDISPRGRKYKKSVEIMHSFTNKVIQERKKEYLDSKRMEVNGFTDENEKFRIKKRRMAFIDVLIETTLGDGEEEKHHLTDEGIREEVDTFMFEGHDTTASGISWTIYLLGRHPDIQEEVAREINEVFGQESIKSTQKLSELRLLDRCIHESLRLYPSVPVIARELNKEVKLGQKFAMQEAKTVVASIVKNYRIESIESPQELVLLMEMILRSQNGIKVRLHPRN
ncbi:cytochrome P450 4C1-like isoform X2 [Ischnura elegans]|uniref:cytochrome P450 4C1-like isoform X2 n=1 Tax=Ischnura elegans TaxID=197161 RepID=UPI001ED8888F|nr:cytochrome P450 4C1-like isoform X2 [Ischnura elegans]